MDARDKILQIMQQKGPLIPAVIAKELKIQLLFAQAYLSELSSKKMVRVSHVKVGGSPLYYLPGQESQLQKFSDRLGEKDLKVYETLQKEKVIREADSDPLTRVSLREMRDFAVRLDVKVDDKVETFWKWYLCSNEEVSPTIKQMIGIEEEAPKKKPPAKKAAPKVKTVEAQQPAQQEISPQTSAPVQQLQEPEPILKQEPILKIPEQKKVAAQPKSLGETIREQKAQEQLAQQVQLGDEFASALQQYFTSHDITILDYTCVRKNSEAELCVLVPSAIGPIEFYCKAKNKKKCSEGDLSMAYLEAQTKKLPPLFLTTGDISKKLRESLPHKMKGLVFKTI